MLLLDLYHLVLFHISFFILHVYADLSTSYYTSRTARIVNADSWLGRYTTPHSPAAAAGLGRHTVLQLLLVGIFDSLRTVYADIDDNFILLSDYLIDLVCLSITQLLFIITFTGAVAMLPCVFSGKQCQGPQLAFSLKPVLCQEAGR